MHEVNARSDARARPRVLREARGEGDHRAGEAGRLHRLERERAALRKTDQDGAARRHAEVGLLAAHQILEVRKHGRDALAMVVAVQAARRIPVLRRAAARVRIEAARHDERRARETRLEFERDRNHRLRGGAAAVQEDEQVVGLAIRRGGEAENPARRHCPDC